MKNAFVEKTQSVSSNTFFEINESFVKNYFYNLFVVNPNTVFHITHDIQNWSPIPFIQYVGVPMILGGAIVAFNRHIEKKEILFLTIVSLIILAFLIAIDYAEYFFMCIIVPVLILGIRSIKKIEQSVLPLLVIPVCFFVMISIIQVHSPFDLFAILLIPPTLTALFILKGIPKIIQFKQSPDKKTVHIRTIIVFTISIIIVSNLIFSYELQAMMMFDDNFDWKDIFGTHDYKISLANEMREIGKILSTEPNIESKYIMANANEFSYHANAKFLYAGLHEGSLDATIMEYVTRQSWSDFEIAASNIESLPNDRYNKHNPLPDYLIYADKFNEIPSLRALQNPEGSNIPENFELLYKNEQSGIFVYKIKHED